MSKEVAMFLMLATTGLGLVLIGILKCVLNEMSFGSIL